MELYGKPLLFMPNLKVLCTFHCALVFYYLSLIITLALVD